MKREQDLHAARDEKLVSTNDRVKIGKSNLRIDPTITQKDETYQQFWFTIKKAKKSSFYQFDIDNKTCQINVELFQDILDISLRIFNSKLTTGSQKSEDVRSCPIPVDNDSVLDRLKFINKEEEYQVYGKPIPDILKWRGKGAQGTKAIVIPKKTTAASKKKMAKKMESTAQLEINTQRAIKARKYESRFQHQSGGSSKGAGLRLEVLDEPTEKSADLDEGAGTLLETDDERMNTDVEDHVKGVAEMNIAKEAEEENAKKFEE
ncbi:hypothetical protein Tco_1080560 [Tanacetum coccineum]|uniref:Uncharacterized protein n=1 Tax=Tanacetum coccineum TaxID=301880 RepID=A0ABQ5HVI9_9ASTR